MEQTSTSPMTAKGPRLLRDPAVGFTLLALGITLIAAAAAMESSLLEKGPWHNAILFLDESPQEHDGIEVRVRGIPLENYPTMGAVVDEFRSIMSEEQFEKSRIDKPESLIIAAMTPTEVEPLLASGRLPEAGRNEVLAGCFTRLDSFEVEGREFRVVGRLEQTLPALSFSYMLTGDLASADSLGSSADFKSGWIDLNGRDHLRTLLEEGELQDLGPWLGKRPSPFLLAWTVFLGVGLVITGGAMVQMRLFRVLATKRCGPLSPMLSALAQHRKLSTSLHAFLYAGFLAAMAVGLIFPFVQVFLEKIVIYEFSEGALSYVADAYLQGNIFLASAATFFNNYCVVTVGFTITPSLLLPYFGVPKTLASLAAAGLILAPAWSGIASHYVYHSITMTLELEAYIIASIAICLYPLHIFQGLQRGEFTQGLKHGLKVVGSGTLLTGLMLALAALFEATTLILFI